MLVSGAKERLTTLENGHKGMDDYACERIKRKKKGGGIKCKRREREREKKKLICKEDKRKHYEHVEWMYV